MATYKSIRYNTPVSNGGSRVLLAETTASSSATVSFTSGIDSTYKEYLFTFTSVHPATDDVKLTFQGNAAGESGFNETITSAMFRSQLDEGDSDSNLLYNAAADQAQGTAFQQLSDNGLGNGNDESMSGYLSLFNPSSTTFVKHFMGRNNMYQKDSYTNDNFLTGYFNTTSAIDEIQFKMSSGNIDAGTFKLYGVN
jgi:hypothetical protein